LNELEGESGMLNNYLSTHPESKDRINSIHQYARKMKWPTSGQTTPIGW
jgi:predicted Zn-dependent protease